MRKCVFGLPATLAALSLAGSAFGQSLSPSLEDLFHPERKARLEVAPPPSYRWLDRGGQFLRQGPGRRLTVVDPSDLTERALLGPERLRELFAGVPGLPADDWERAATRAEMHPGPDGTGVVLTWAGNLYWYRVGAPTLQRLTDHPSTDELPRFSPDGGRLAFVRDHDLFVAELESGRIRRLTHDGSPTLLNGKLDWVYWEEVFHRAGYHAFWWSPCGRRIAFLQSDVSAVPSFPLTDEASPYPGLRQQRYPKAGTVNPVVRVGIADLARDGVRWLDLPTRDEEFLVVRVHWAPDGKELLIQLQDRAQTRLDLFSAEVDSGEVTSLLVETSPAWVEPVDGPARLPGGDLLWVSARTGFRHLYRLARPGNQVSPLTSGAWEVRSLAGVDAGSGWIYFTGTRDSVREVHLYRIPVSGGEPERLTEQPGTHEVRMRDDGSYLLDSWSNHETPPRVALRDAAGKLLQQLHVGEFPATEWLTGARLEPLRFQARDGVELEATLLYPPDFEPSRRYPVLLHVYGGPMAPIVVNRWVGANGLWHRVLADHGVVVCMVDPRAASGRGPGAAWPSYRRLGVAEFADLEDALDRLEETGWADMNRVGIWGSSYGGYLSAYAAVRSKRIRLGIAVAPVTDWRWYDTIYTERFMGTPGDNPEGYRDASVVEAAGSLSGRLLLIHGTADDNVHLQHTLQLASALQGAGKQFDLMVYPGAQHGIRDPWQVYHYRRLKTDFVLREFGLAAKP